VSEYEPLLLALLEDQPKIRLDNGHCYWYDRKRKASVSAIRKMLDSPFLDDWKVEVQVEGTALTAYRNPPLQNEPAEAYVARMVSKLKEYEHERRSKAAAEVGTQVHRLIEHAVKSQLGIPCPRPAVQDEAMFRFSGWQAWAKSVGLKPLMSEGRTYNSRDNYCGTFDLLALLDGRLVIIDFKPTKGLYPDRILQLIAYSEAVAQYGSEVPVGYLNCVSRDGGPFTLTPAWTSDEQRSAAWEAFRACLQLYRWQASLRKDEASLRRQAKRAVA
jgi:hypothetical protein